MARPTFKLFKAKALRAPGVAEAYDELAPAYALRKKLVAIRQQAGLTQEQVAERLHTSKSNISRLESVRSKISPKLSTIEEYAEAIGYELKINFVRRKNTEHNKRMQSDAAKPRR
jgi:transcriptional regulator with XRE-family HTH domain